VSFAEVVRMALGTLRTNRLRSALTMLGVSIGVFSVIGVMTALTVIEGSIETGLSFLGSNIFQFAKYPLVQAGGGSREDTYANRRDVTLAQANDYKQRMEGRSSAVCLKCFNYGRPVGYARNRAQGFDVVGSNEWFLVANACTIAYGRNLTPEDVDLGRAVVVVGYSVQKKLFPSQSPIGEWMRVDGKPYQIVGVMQEKGTSFGRPQDDIVIVPITRFFADFGSSGRTVNVATQSVSQATYNPTLDQGIGAMRLARGLKLGQPNDFEIYSNDSLVTAFAQVSGSIRTGAFVVSAIALLAAGIGIMNIMLVSVTERTREIGLRKAIGARRTDILRQFLIEAVVLAEVGGLAGIVLGVVGGNGVAFYFDMSMVFPWLWALTGLVVCSAIGIGFGLYPAWRAASLDPIDALRYE
jgi:putative ABC transport system permease protein